MARNILNNNLNDATTFDGEGDERTEQRAHRLRSPSPWPSAWPTAICSCADRSGSRSTRAASTCSIQGIVRPIDISPDNTVPSTQVADAVIAYGGQGTLADANTKGWLARFFDSKWMPF